MFPHRLREVDVRDVQAGLPRQSLGEEEAREIVDTQVTAITENWLDTCGQAGLSTNDRRVLAGAAIFNPYVFTGYSDPVSLPDR